MSEKINGAYEILGDDEKRVEYDNSRNNPFSRMNSHGGGGMEVPMDDIFNMFFGGQSPFGHQMNNPFGGFHQKQAIKNLNLSKNQKIKFLNRRKQISNFIQKCCFFS